LKKNNIGYNVYINISTAGKTAKDFIMKKGKFFALGILAMVLVLGLVLAGCDNGTTTKAEYHLKWGATSTSYSTVQSTITSQGWTVADSGTNWAVGAGSTATTIYNWCMANVSFSDGGDFDGSFEECINYTKDGSVSAPSALKTALNNNKSNVPLAGIFDGGYAILFYITKN
jgi:hypothetical protein